MTDSKSNDSVHLASQQPLNHAAAKVLRPGVKTSMALSPAVSAFQFKSAAMGSSTPSFHHQPSSLSPTIRSLELGARSISSEGGLVSSSVVQDTQDLRRSLSNGGLQSPGPEIISPSSPVIKDGYVYKDEIVILDQQKKEELLNVGEITLQTEWTFWYDRYVPNLPPTEYEANLQVISTVGSVQKFWSVYNNIDGPEKLGFRSNLHFMRKGIKPIWEDPRNEYGGSFNFKIPKAQSPLAWRDLLVLLIGERVEGCIDDTVCGVSVSSRQQCDSYQIWTANGHNSAQDVEVQNQLASLMKPAEIQSFYFKIHKNHAAFQKPREVASKSWKTDASSPLGKSASLRPTEMRRKITEENIEKVVADIERLGLKHKEKSKMGYFNTNSSSSAIFNKDIK
ncbi:translation initiation factor eIF 4e-like domain-containing protein [Phycomyces blakesleeanus]